MMEATIKVMPERFLVLHYHIFKNAGSSIDYALRRYFANAFVSLHGEGDGAVVRSVDLLGFLQEHPDVRAVTSHHLRYPRPELDGLVVWDICSIRHPLDRIRSLFHYGRRLGSGSWLGDLASSHDEPGFVAALVDNAPHVISDAQVIYLSRAGVFNRPANAMDFTRAERIMADASVLNVVDILDFGLVSAEYFLSPVFPGFSMAYVAQNVSSPRGVVADHDGGEDALSEACRDAWGGRLFAQVLSLNAFDMHLYRMARQEVLRRFSLLPDAAGRLEGFRSRCASLI